MDYLTMQDIADRLGVQRASVQRYRARGELPAPDRMVGRTPIWYPTTIEQWQVNRPGRGVRRDLAVQ